MRQNYSTEYSLKNKTVAVSGSTGGIGHELCRHLANLGASLLLLDRNAARSQAHKKELQEKYNVSVECIPLELEDIQSVKNAAARLSEIGTDILILNAGAYKIPRHKCTTGFDNIFQINFASPYLLASLMLPHLRERHGKVVAVASIAHRYSKADKNDIDFSTRKSCALAYGNAKRYLMFSLYELFKGENDVSLSIVHPGITLTNITAHYPKVIFAIIKYPMKVIFMSPRKASLCVLQGVFDSCKENEWIGPRIFDIWGKPKKRKLKPISSKEHCVISKTARDL